MDENDGSDGWTMVPACRRGVVNDAVAVYLRDAALEAAFVARWCAVDRAEVANGRSGFATMSRSRVRLGHQLSGNICLARGFGDGFAAADANRQTSQRSQKKPPSHAHRILLITMTGSVPNRWREAGVNTDDVHFRPLGQPLPRTSDAC